MTKVSVELQGEAPAPSPPRVVVGVPADSEAPVEKVETKAEARLDVTRVLGTPKVEEAPKKPKDLGTATLAFGSSEAAKESKESKPSSSRKLTATQALGSSIPDSGPKTAPMPVRPAPVKVEEKRVEPVKVEEKKVAPVKLEPVKTELPKVEPAKVEPPKESPDERRTRRQRVSSRPPAAQATTKALEPDEISVPPIVTIDDKTANDFFSESERMNLAAMNPLVAPDDALTVPDKAKRKSDPVVAERRAHLARYVRWAVGGAAVLCLAAMVLSLLPSSKKTAPVRVETPATETKAALPAAAPAPPTPPTSDIPPPEPTAEPSAELGAAAAEEVTGDPKEEKAKTRKALERRKLDEAIEAGEKAVKLDPTDGEAWLLLGAAYQDKGNLPEARRAYQSCVKEATTGPKAECQKMLRF